MNTLIERRMPRATDPPVSQRGAKAIAAWTTTGVLAAAMTVSGVSFVLQLPPVVAMLNHLGYPGYLCSLLGIAKLLGVAALLIPGLPTLREWGYAGFAILLAGAIASHLLAGDGPVHALPAAVLAGTLLASYRLRRRTTSREVAHD